MDELLGEFLTETNENIEFLDSEIIKLEKNPNDTETLAHVFRLVHTIKGTCGFLDLHRLEKVAHAAENVLGNIRDNLIQATPDIITVIFNALDKIKEILDVLEDTQTEPEGEDSALIATLDAIVKKAESGDDSQKNSVENSDENVVAIDAEQHVDTVPEQLTPCKSIIEQAAPIKTSKPKAPAQSIRVNVDILENLMTLVSELVLTRNQLLQVARLTENNDFNIPLQGLSHLTSELQEGIMKTRMQPIGNAWAPLPRIIRDLSNELGKKIELKMTGENTELDRQVLELIKDPLTHMIRNAADHGIEDIEERLAANKPETGVIKLDAFHEGGHIIIQIADDGKGLDPEKIRAKIINQGLASTDEMKDLSDQQIYQYIFKPGFSTAVKVTAVSGRGVGMDVVRTNIEKISGTIDLESTFTKGSTFTIKIPLTLAIISTLIVECKKEKFAIPQLNVAEIVQVTAKSEHQIEKINDARVLRLRDRLLPLIKLDSVLNMESSEDQEIGNQYIIVTHVGAYKFGLIVDAVNDAEEIVVKPIASILSDISVFSGNTILGDGSVILILDPNGLANTIKTVGSSEDLDEDDEKNKALLTDLPEFLLFKAGSDDTQAVLLSLVTRLEDIRTSDIEKFSSDRPVVKYRDSLMPLVNLSSNKNLSDKSIHSTLVFYDNNRYAGIIVDEIIDIVRDKLNIQLEDKRDGYVGDAIIAEKAVDILDVGHFLTMVYDDWFDSSSHSKGGNPEGSKHILLVDDSHFFINLLLPVLSGAGYKVAIAKSGSEALEYYEDKIIFDLILTDIEMPDMTGYELAQKIKELDSWAKTPIIAISAHTSEEHLRKGRQAGFDDYIAKIDRESLIESIKSLVA
jgi:two-component system, chemotaxis family, sensor kinase CheA